MSSNQAGKGDKPRPVNKKIYDQNYDEIFDKKSNSAFSSKVKATSTKGIKTVYKY